MRRGEYFLAFARVGWTQDFYTWLAFQWVAATERSEVDGRLVRVATGGAIHFACGSVAATHIKQAKHIRSFFCSVAGPGFTGIWQRGHLLQRVLVNDTQRGTRLRLVRSIVVPASKRSVVAGSGMTRVMWGIAAICSMWELSTL